MNARSLLAWGDLEERRRRRSRGLVARAPGFVWSLLIGAGLTLWLAEAAGALSDDIPLDFDRTEVIRVMRIWLALVIAAAAIGIFSAPFRMYWRRDSALLARLAIDGDALFRVAQVRSIRAASTLFAGPALLAVALAPITDGDVALRHLALIGVGWVGAALLGPAVALAGGAIVASEKVDALVSQMGGEFSAPKTGWLGILPGLAATVVVLTVIAGADWALGAQSTPVASPAVLLLSPVLLSVVAAAWANARAGRVMIDAVREVAALDQERLAHVEQTRPSVIESAVSRLLGRRARMVFEKDVRLGRRRYPLPYFLSLLGTLALWGVAIAAPADTLTWSLVITACLGAYAIVMARRRGVPPIEYPAYLRTLPLTASDIRRGKSAQSISWIAVFIGLGIVPVILRAPSPLVTAIALGAVAVVSLIAALAASR